MNADRRPMCRPPGRRPGRGRWLLPALVLLLLVPLASTVPSTAAEEGKALDVFFRGRVVALDPKTKTVTLRYDFGSEEQMKDWQERAPFPLERAQGTKVAWFDQMLEISGSTGVRHVGAWKGDVTVRCAVVPDAEKDMGGILHPADGGDDIATFTLLEEYFHKWDGKSGGQHSIIKFGKQWREAGSTKEYVGFRYVTQRAPASPLVAGRTIPLEFGHSKGRLFMNLPEIEMKGRDLGKRFKDVRPGFYTVAARMMLDDIEITGELDPDWMKEHGVALRTEAPISAAGAGVDAATQEALAAYRAGGAPPTKLLEMVKDVHRTDEVRKLAADTLAAGPKAALRQVLDLLYDTEVSTRTYGIGIVKAMLGKDYGYNPKGSESSRSAAIRKMNEDLKERPELLRD